MSSPLTTISSAPSATTPTSGRRSESSAAGPTTIPRTRGTPSAPPAGPGTGPRPARAARGPTTTTGGQIPRTARAATGRTPGRTRRRTATRISSISISISSSISTPTRPVLLRRLGPTGPPSRGWTRTAGSSARPRDRRTVPTAAAAGCGPASSRPSLRRLAGRRTPPPRTRPSSSAAGWAG